MTALTDSPRRLRAMRVELEAEALAEDLGGFIEQAWPLVEPATPFISNWHIRAIAEHLEAVSRGEIRRLIINIPPRHMKSLAVSVFWPTWLWTTRPEIRWLFASYAQKLSIRDSLKCRRLIDSRWYQDRWSDVFQLTGDQNEKTRFENDRTGYRIATSVGGTATGEGGDIIVIDDPHKADEAESDVMREAVLDWHDGTMSTRLNDPRVGAEVIIMQRVHEADLAGHLLARGGWEHLCLPAEYEPTHPFVWPDDPRTHPGELLWPDRVGQPELDELKETLGSYRAAGQLQQRPAPLEGGILKRSWWQYYGAVDDLRLDGVMQSWDTAWKDKQTSDYTVGQVWGWKGANRYLLAQVRERMDEPTVKREIRSLSAWVAETFQGFDIHPVVVESANVGPDIVADLRRSLPGIQARQVRGDKTQRAHAVAPQLEAGQVFLPGYDEHSAPAFAQDLVTECASFPNAAYDDQVDAMTQALIYLRDRRGGERSEEPRPERRQMTAGLRDRSF